MLQEHLQWDDVEKVYREGIVAVPGHASLFFNLGVLLKNGPRKDFNGAIEAFTSAVKADPTIAVALRNLGALMLDKKMDTTAAEVYYRRSLQLDPDNHRGQEGLKRVLAAQKVRRQHSREQTERCDSPLL